MFLKEGSSSYKRNRLFSKSHNHHCRLLRYTVKDAVACFDALYQEQVLFNFQQIYKKANKATKLFFVFMGDSRIRQQFFNFLQVSNIIIFADELDFSNSRITTQLQHMLLEMVPF